MLRIGRRQALFATLTAGTSAGAVLSMTLPPRPASAQGSALLGQLVEGPPRALPELSFTDEEGTRKSVADFAGKGLVVNFWATWCAPCVEEMPSLDRLQELVEREGILVLPLSSDRGGASQVRGFYARTRVRNLDIWLDPQGAAGRALGVRGLPTTLVLDRQGREVARLEGSADWSAPEKLEAIRRLLAAPAPERPTST